MIEFQIKDFGNDRRYSSLEALLHDLEKLYRTMHVSIVFPVLPNGLKRVVFVSVSHEGEIRETYGANQLVSADYIESLIINKKEME